MSVYVREIPEFRLDGLPLGRHVEHDDRSRAFTYQIPDKLRAAPLQPVRHQRFAPVLDQGTLRSCTGNAAEGVAGTGPVFQVIPQAVAARPDTNDARAAEDQAVALYSAATQLDGIPGQWTPDDTGSTGVAAAKALVQAGLIAGYQHTFTLADALAALQIVPLMFGTNWYDSFDVPSPDGVVRITPGAQVRGGHQYVADELIPSHQLVGATQSWGLAWGLQGRFYVPWSDLERLLGEQGDVIVPVPLSQPKPQPAEPSLPVQPAWPSLVETIDQLEREMFAAFQRWAQARHII